MNLARETVDWFHLIHLWQCTGIYEISMNKYRVKPLITHNKFIRINYNSGLFLKF